MDIELNSCFGFDVSKRLLKRCNYNTAVRICATLLGRTLRKSDAFIMLAIGRLLPLAPFVFVLNL